MRLTSIPSLVQFVEADSTEMWDLPHQNKDWPFVVLDRTSANKIQ